MFEANGIYKIPGPYNIKRGTSNKKLTFKKNILVTGTENEVGMELQTRNLKP